MPDDAWMMPDDARMMPDDARMTPLMIGLCLMTTG
jgi:hypothetical protein